MTLTLSQAQQDALAKVREWHAKAILGDAPQVFRLFGYAGTGKTTIAKEMQNFARKVQYGAFTGKAALVLSKKGCTNARTIHSLIYRAIERSSEELKALKEQLKAIENDPAHKEVADDLRAQIKRLREEAQQPGWSLNLNAFIREWDDEAKEFVSLTPPDLLCIDECSMVDRRLGQDLEYFKIPILVLGDPAQLPPVGGGGYFTEATPDVLLTEIHRQAGNNPIIDIATKIRTGRMPGCGTYGDSRILSRVDISRDELREIMMGADQVLCGRNATRDLLNTRMRELKGYAGILPEVGERVICLRNNHTLGLLNGSMWEVQEVEDLPTEPYFKMTVRSLDEERDPVVTKAHKKVFLREEWEDQYERREADEFDFGYAITTHKAQGSEWGNVVYVDEWPSFKREELRRHQYTGVTRASERITVVKW
jgi:exodeoxyribonuclease-5